MVVDLSGLSSAQLLAKTRELSVPAGKGITGVAALLLMRADLLGEGMEFCDLYVRDLTTLLDKENYPKPEHYSAEEVFGERLSPDEIRAMIDEINSIRGFLERVKSALVTGNEVTETEQESAREVYKKLHALANLYQNYAGVVSGERRKQHEHPLYN